jgi:peptide/nickel transport system substrate-binding protein
MTTLAACGTGSAAERAAGVLRFAYTAFPSTLDPHKASTAWDELYLFPAYDRVVTKLPDGTRAPMIAESWRRDGEKMVFKIRAGARFHDGAPVDAEAVRLNLERARTMPDSTAKTLLRMTREITVRGQELVVGFVGSPEGLLDALAHRAGALISPSAFTNQDLGRRPIGSGPYRVTSFRRDDSVIYAPFDGYYDRSAQRLRGLEMSFVNDDDTRLNGVRSGQYDATLMRPEQVQTARRAELAVHEFMTGLVYQLNINAARSKFADQRVRRALNLAVDRRAIGEQLLQGSCVPAVQAAPPGNQAHDDSLEDEYDPLRARALLAEAGGDFEFTALVWNNTAYVQLAEVIQDQFKQVGVTMHLRPVSVEQSLDSYQVKRDADALLSQIGGAAPNPALIAQQNYLAAGLNNPGKLTDPRIEQLVAHAATADQPAQQADFRQIARYAVDNAYNVPICNRRLHYATTLAVRDFDLLLKGYDDIRVVGKS